MSLSLSRARVFVASVLVTGGGALVLPSMVAAHQNTVSCQSPGVWLIVNSEADKAEEFTTNEGHSGNISAGGSTTVNFSGTSLTVDGYWPITGARNTATGTGDCTRPATTVPATTVPPASSVAPATVAPATTPVVSVLSQVAVTTPAVDPAEPAGETSGLNQTLPATGSNSVTGAVVGGILLALGGGALFAGRRKPNLAD